MRKNVKNDYGYRMKHPADRTKKMMSYFRQFYPFNLRLGKNKQIRKL